MKRSKMLDRLELLLESRNDADMVLTMCEDSGMLPPRSFKQVQEMGGPIDGVWITTETNAWDDE
jgi:hypothetical protein